MSVRTEIMAPDVAAETGENQRIPRGNVETSRKETLLKTSALQDAIFNSAYFSCIATDDKGVIQIFNVGAERMLGYTAAEVTNKITPADISDPLEVIARAEALSRELHTLITPGFEALVFKASRGIEDIYELTYIRKDSSRFPAIVSVTPLSDDGGEIIGYLLIGTDNTARKLEVDASKAVLDQRFRDQQFYTRSLFESNIDALMTTDPQGVISDVNEQMISLTGRTRDELIGAPCRDFFTDPVAADAAIRRVLTENKVSDYELTVRSRNGELTVVSYNAAVIHNRDREVQGVFAAARDVTERKRIERTLEEKNIELEHASRMKSEFLATMSHELRTPLNAIIGFSEALKDGLMGRVSDTQQEYITDIFSSGQHLLSLINDILDLSKVEAGMMTVDLEAVDIKGLLSNSLSIVREKAGAQSIRLELEMDDGLDICQLDIRKTKQIIYNLLSNAVKFSAQAGSVKLKAHIVPRAVVGTMTGGWPVHGFPLSDNEYDSFLEIRVEDQGIGISQENMARLFQAFSQIDSGLARKFEGTGLGLAMVKQLTELLGGTVAVASAEGEGACFGAWLPLHGPIRAAIPPPQREVAPATASVASDIAQKTALVVEDDDRSADLVRLLLEAEGFSVLLASSGEAALLTAPQQPLSLITLDIQLPGIDGWEFLMRIGEMGALAQVPVVIISGLADGNLALTKGAAAVLQKPISRVQLKASLSNLGLHPAKERIHTVLVVDDDPAAVELIGKFLQAPDYAVVRAYSGSEAVTLAHTLKPDLILLDLMMPDMSGFEVVKVLQGDAETAGIPIVVVTAKSVTANDRSELNSAAGKVIQFVDKAGFDSERFVAEVRRSLPPSETRKYVGQNTDR